MIENFPRSVWKRGGLAGSTSEEAFEVHVGLGDTMTAAIFWKVSCASGHWWQSAVFLPRLLLYA